MRSSFERRELLLSYPDQAAYWQGIFGESFEETRLVKDLSPERELPWTELTVTCDDAPFPQLDRLTGGDAQLETLVHVSVASVLAARATGTRYATCLLQTGGDLNPALPVRTDLRNLRTFREALLAIRSRYVEALAHRDVPIRAFLEERELRPTDLGLVVDEQGDATVLTDLGCRVVLRIVRRASTLDVRVTYDPGALLPGTVERLAEWYIACLRRCAADPNVPLVDLYAADADERRLVDSFNRTEASFPEERLLHSFLEERAAAEPDLPALRQEELLLSYGALNRRANRIALALRATGVGPEAVVAVCLPRSADMVAAIYGVLKAGGAYLPLDPDLPHARLAYLLSDSDAACVVGTGRERDRLPAEVPFLDLGDVTAGDGGDENPAAIAAPRNLCYVIYTSGSTGQPKGVMVEHRAIVNRLSWMSRRYGLERRDVILHKTPCTFDVSVWELFWWSMTGASVRVLPHGEERNPERIVAEIDRGRCTTVHFVPSMLHGFLRYVEATGAAPGLASLRRVFASGEALTPGHVERFAETVGRSGDIALINLYGPTEAAVDVSFHDCPASLDGRPVPIGGPIANIKLHVSGPDGEPAPLGTPGELSISGVGLARGYRNQPALTARQFVPADGDRRYLTGDRARWRPDGNIEYLGRVDAQVKIRGMRIEPAEIERVLGVQPGVEDCVVRVFEPTPGDRALCAYVVGEADEAALRRALEASLPIWMAPQYFVQLSEIPRTSSGKRDLRRLPAPSRARPAARAPVGDLERRLAAVWGEVLGVDAVGRDDHFFALGGDSIRFIAVLAACREVGIDFSFEQLFDNPTVASLAASIEENAPQSRAQLPGPFELVPREDQARLPGTAVEAYPQGMLQAGTFFESERSGNPRLYHDIFTHRVRRKLDPELFARAVDLVAQRHEIFRSTFYIDGYSLPMQVVHATAPSPLRIFDLRGISPEEQERRLREYVDLELAARFRPELGGLVRVHVHLLGDADFQYTLSFHDAALDGWSVHLLHVQIFQAYLALEEGGDPVLVQSPVPYRAYAAMERAAVLSEEQRQFWLDYLEEVDKTRIPRYVEPPEVNSVRAVMHAVDILVELSDGLRRLAATLGVPLKSVLLAVHVKVLSYLAGTDDVLTGYEHSGRPELAGADEMIGLFLNTIPFRVDCAEGTWAELIRRTQAAEAKILRHRRYPMAEIKRALNRREVLFDVVFNFTHFHVLKRLSADARLDLVVTIANAQTEFPFRAEFGQDALTDRVILSLDTHEHEFTPEQVERIAGYYLRAMRQMVDFPDESHNARSLMADEEVTLLRETFAGPVRELPSQTFIELFEAVARQHPDRLALRHRDRDVTYAQLDAEADRLARGLSACGAGNGDVIGIAMERGVEWALGILAVWKLGAVYCPIDLGHPAPRLRWALERSSARVVLTTVGARSRTAALTDEAAGTGPQFLVFEEVTAGAPDRPVDRRLSLDDPAYVIFTSGSTGQPKGAVLGQRGMLNHLHGKIYDFGMTATDRLAQNASPSFDISIWQLIAPWLLGGASVIYDDRVVLEPGELLRRLQSDGVTILELVPSYLDALLALEDALPPLPTLRSVLVQGEPLTPRMAERWFQRYDIVLVNGCGATEASDDVTHHFLTGPVHGGRVPIGRPIQNMHAHVLGPRGELRPLGCYGELCYTGVGVGLGYIDDPERTARAFVWNRVDDRSAIMYRTGDVARWLPSGVLDVQGRIDHQVKVRGFRIELAEVEGAVERVPGVEQAVAVVQETGGSKQLVAFYVGPAEPDMRAFRAVLADLVPTYMIPDHVVRLDRWPLNSNGKIDRRQLGDHQLGVAVPSGNAERPATPTENRIADLFAAVLGADRAVVSVEDNFFDLGGHSIAAMRMAARSQGLLTVRQILAHPTVRQLARQVDDLRARRPELLVDLSAVSTAGQRGHTEATVVCAPYGGGDAVTFVPLARQLSNRGIALRLLGIQMPGRTIEGPDSALVDFEDLATRCVEELRASVQGPIAVLGHCSGATLALRVARKLEDAGADVRHLAVVARLVRSTSPDFYAFNEAVHWDDDHVLEWLVDQTGMTEVMEMSGRERADMARAFRHDAVQAYHVMHAALQRVESARVAAPITVLVAEDDPMTESYQEVVRNWSVFTSRLDVVTSPTGGHYLTKTKPGLLADLLRSRILGPQGPQ